MIVDFRLQEKRLFAGREHARREKASLLVDDGDEIIKLYSNENQCITSSFFLGLFEDHFSRFANLNELRKVVNLDGLKGVSEVECIRAMRRAISWGQK